MQYSLFNRFRGALVGAIMGEVFGAYVQKQSPSQKLNWRSRQQLPRNFNWAFPSGPELSNESQNNPPKWATWHLESLIRQGILTTKPAEKLFITPSSLNSRTDITYEHSVITWVPIALFFHEQQGKLQENLIQVIEGEKLKIVLIIARAIGWALQGKLEPEKLIREIINELQSEHNQEKSDSLIQQLEQVERLIQQNAGIEMVERSIWSADQITPVAVALYCFLSTPTDFRLSVIRASRIGNEPQLTCAIAAVLSGTYNGITGIPLSWRLTLNRKNAINSLLKSIWGINSGTEIETLSDRLLSAWVGIYHPNSPIDPHLLQTITAPQVR